MFRHSFQSCSKIKSKNNGDDGDNNENDIECQMNDTGDDD